ncbi:nuclear matrix protein [Macroventuria anomochaeta]|uniref:Nuclear matrix protein n=1 Tax=Macroventuria anomochaeta TaxID=301207 RepID=A0ACB6SI04_9PLEO|nr:nuclear matrix protein [Macroventuria anomochaeta]KAF2633618.1 nuclear matrix protein [Macroventuria anomochaeta]
MAVPIVGASQISTAARLDELLQRARTVKPSTSIEPPLQVSELVPENGPLFSDINGEKDVLSTAVESAAKGVFYANIGLTRIDEPAFITVWNLLDILQYCGDRDVCSAQLVLLLIEELLDSQSLAQCRTVFSFLESRREAIIAISSQNKSLVILRLCNELLRRLSRAEDPVFCGRVYIFMFQSFPLGDKSSVNLRGNFHVENVTTFEEFLTESSTNEDPMQVDNDANTPSIKTTAEPEDLSAKPPNSRKSKEGPPTLDIDTLYPVFWSLQHSFSNPPRLFEENNFKDFRSSLEATLAKFKEVPKVIQSGDIERKKGSKPSSGDSYDAFANTFNPKYLTSRDLFKLELSDLAFQRHILVQALILIDFLLTLTEKAKSKSLYQNAQKAMQYNFTMREQDTEWALGIKTAVANYLQEGPDGKFYYRMVDTVLSRDKNWVRWKMENCQPFTRKRVDTAEFLTSKSDAVRAVSKKRPNEPTGVSSSLNFLYNTEAEKGLSQLRQRDRFNAPSAEIYAKKAKMIDLDLEIANNDAEKRELEEKKSSYIWRGLRAASQKQLSSFDKIEHGKGLEALQPVPSQAEIAGDNTAPTVPEDRDAAPQEEQHSVEEQRAEQRSQVTADTEME